MIETGSQYYTWTQLGGYDAGTVKMHTECYEAHADNGYEDFEPYQHGRGG